MRQSKSKVLKLILLSLVLINWSCSDDDGDSTDPDLPDFTLSFNVETNEDQMGAFSHNKMTVFNDEVWSVGGFNIYHTGLHSDVWKSTNGVNWQSVTSEQFPNRRGHILTVFDNKLWLIGGFTETSSSVFSALSDVWYSMDGTNWTLATEEPFGIASISNHGAVVFNNQLYVIKDGSNEGMPGCSVWSTNDGINWIRQTGNAFSSRENYAINVFNNEIYVVGGNDASTFYNEIWKSSDGTNWTQVTTPSSFPQRANGVAVVYENKLWILGGSDGTTTTSLGLWYTDNGNDWFSYEPLPAEDGLEHFNALSYNDAIWVFGGLREEVGFGTRPRVGTINTIKQD